jgi:hypothetical protein
MTKEADNPIVIVAVPPLVWQLQFHEAKKGSPLTEAEVQRIRDEAICMTMPRSEAQALAAGRGYDDIDPEDVLNEWKRIRSEGGA